MPVKPPNGGRTHVKVDASTSPTRPADVDIPLPGPSGRRGSGSGVFPDNPQSRAGGSATTDIDAIRPAPAVVVHAGSAEVHLPAPQPSLDDYVTTFSGFSGWLPHVNSEGVRMINERTYVDLSRNGTDFVLVAQDKKTGLYRARRPSELLPSGPVLLRNPDTGLWYPRVVVEPSTRAQIQRYFPEIDDLDADAFIARFDDKDVAEVELKRIQLGLAQLDSEHVDIPKHQPRIVGDNERPEALDMWRRLRQVYKWQGPPHERVYNDGQTVGFQLDINLTLWPVDKLLSLKFDSVVSLTLRGHAPVNPKVFFAQFPNIESLTIRDHVITRDYSSAETEGAFSRFIMGTRFADQLTRLPRLRELNLQDCTLLDGISLGGMSRLQVLRVNGTRKIAARGEPVPSFLQMLDEVEFDSLPVIVDVTWMPELRVLDLTRTGLHLLPLGSDTNNAWPRLEVLRLGDNSLANGPSLKTMPALQELDLSNTELDGFPEGITSEVPRRVLNLANNRIASIPEFVELRSGFILHGNPITDPVSLRRLIAARRETGSDIWLDGISADQGINHWMHNISETERPAKVALWNSLATRENHALMQQIRALVRTPEFQVERQLLQRRVWSFLGFFQKVSPVEQSRLRNIATAESSPGKMLERLEDEINKSDPQWQNPPLHHLPKRPKFE